MFKKATTMTVQFNKDALTLTVANKDHSMITK